MAFNFDILKKVTAVVYDWEWGRMTLTHADGSKSVHEGISLQQADAIEREMQRRASPATEYIPTPQSSSIKGYAYNPGTEELTIWYVRSGRKFIYPGIDPQVFAMLEAAQSKGSFVYHNIQHGGRR